MKQLCPRGGLVSSTVVPRINAREEAWFPRLGAYCHQMSQNEHSAKQRLRGGLVSST